MTYYHIRFDDYKAFQAVQKLAQADGYETVDEFHHYLDLNYNK